MKSLFCSSNFLVKPSTAIYLIAFFISSIILTGCSTAPTFIKPDYDKKQIRTIAVMPTVDKRNLVDDTTGTNEILSNIEELIAVKIMDKNYDVLSAIAVKNIIEEKAIQNMTPENLCSTLKVDGILFSELFDYTDVFFINHSIKMNFKIYDAQGDSLWINDLDDSERPFLSAIAASLGWAIGVIIDNKISSKNKTTTIIAGVAAAELVYGIVDAIRNETAESIDRVFDSLPKLKGTMK